MTSSLQAWPAVELFGAVDVGDRDDDYFELHVDCRDTLTGRLAAANLVLPTQAGMVPLWWRRLSVCRN